MAPQTIHRGDIFIVRLDPTEGHEQEKTRPCVVISRDSINRSGTVVIVIPLTSKGTDTANLTHRILLKEQDKIQEPDTQGCLGDNVALVFQLRAIDASVRFMENTRRARLTTAALGSIEAALVHVLDIF
jgi:mRNA-degrading endonuclease toxin of MazEF toxin-antitoxin module